MKIIAFPETKTFAFISTRPTYALWPITSFFGSSGQTWTNNLMLRFLQPELSVLVRWLGVGIEKILLIINTFIDSAYQSDSLLILLTILKLFEEVPIFYCKLNAS